uniref:Uncharacterized protein n=1 Tax=Mus spicilegus TaxID=10103 RepID=A0A8C6HVI0_MUSSI
MVGPWIMAAAVKWVISNRTIWKYLFPFQNGNLSTVYYIHVLTVARQALSYSPALHSDFNGPQSPLPLRQISFELLPWDLG